MAPTLYDVLEVSPIASPQTIQAAYRSLVTRYHPDKVLGLSPEAQAAAAERAKTINAAYSVLKDPARRRRYDDELARQTRRETPPVVVTAPSRARAPSHSYRPPSPAPFAAVDTRLWGGYALGFLVYLFALFDLYFFLVFLVTLGVQRLRPDVELSDVLTFTLAPEAMPELQSFAFDIVMMAVFFSASALALHAGGWVSRRASRAVRTPMLATIIGVGVLLLYLVFIVNHSLGGLQLLFLLSTILGLYAGRHWTRAALRGRRQSW